MHLQCIRGKVCLVGGITIYDVARECNVSVSTVSRVLNGSVLVGEKRRREVEMAAQRLGFNKRPIKKHGKRVILNIELYLPETGTAFAHMFYDVSELVDGLRRGFDKVKVNVIVKINRPGEDIYSNKKLGDIDACVFAFTEPNDKLIVQLDKYKIPIVLLNRRIEGCAYVKYDDQACMSILLEKIIARHMQSGRQKVQVGYIGFAPVSRNQERKTSLDKACRRYGIDFDLRRNSFDFNAIGEMPLDFAAKLHKKKYNVIICFNDVVAISFYVNAMNNNLSIPEDFSLTGYDDSPMLEILPKRIDTIRFDVELMGWETGTWLKQRIINREGEMLEKMIVGDYVAGKTI